MNNLTEKEIIEKYTKNGIIDWRYISRYNKLSESFIEKYQDKVDWDYISLFQKLSEDFIEKFKDKVDWDYISEVQKLSESFIEKFQDKVKWRYISAFQKLSESFIEKYQDKVSWYFISQSQKLSDEFSKKHNIDSNILNVIHYCGEYNRPIYIYKNEPMIIYIGCFKGTKDEAIKEINLKYGIDTKEAIEYIDKVNECFNF